MEDKKSESDKPAKRGRPRTRYAERAEQVKQNMRLYRARRAAELESLERAMASLATALAGGDLELTFRAAAAASGLWESSSIKDNVINSRRKRKSGAGNA